MAVSVTVDISQNRSNPGGNGFNVTSQTALLPQGFSDVTSAVESIFANDAAVLQVNGKNLVGWGIFGPGEGRFAFSEAGPFEPFTFRWGHGHEPAATYWVIHLGDAVVGPSHELTIKLFHNDNNAGINGSSFAVHAGELQFNATLRFDAPAVPEPGARRLGVDVVRRRFAGRLRLPPQARLISVTTCLNLQATTTG